MNWAKEAATPHGQDEFTDREKAGDDADGGAPPAIVDATGTAPDMAGLASPPCSTEDLTGALAALRDAAASHDSALPAP